MSHEGYRRTTSARGRGLRGRLSRSSVAWIAAVVVVGILAVYALGGSLSKSSTSTFSETTSTNYVVQALPLVQAAAQQNPSGYNLTSSKALPASYPGEQTGAYAILAEPESAGNMTVLVFGTTNSSQTYYNSFVSQVEGLPGYTDISGVLSGYTQYGYCYAYGEDVDGIAVANGICTDGNVFLQVHLSSSEPFSQLEVDLSNFMGAMYDSVE